ncbi:hypothetical protein FEM03_09885 [Phragmitibacter flavus]|uniref:DUF4230 domain-containing protein n=1 Tax=Phragmitibacter flavus TaxID=2576071 RepID=A0A5R8KFW8_9BACT|nr:hypothetical protein [Phragmitibacter flavus]TLD71204.1 hypothetical protein FEM03_09885 [Phragmitibacter flavus]
MSDSLIPPDYFEQQRAGGRRSGRMGCFGASALVLIVLMLLGAGMVFYFGMPLKQLFDKVVMAVGAGEFFKTKGSVSEHRDVILEILPTHGDVLEVASPMKTTEIFRKSDSRYGAWGWVYLGTATSEIRVPAVYRFHIKLSEMKKARLEDGVLTIEAPPAQPSLPVAIDTSGLEKKSDGTWLRFDSAQQLDELEKSITPELNARAARHLTTIRETARSDIQKFVQKWIVEAHPSYQSEVKAVRIVFPDEPLEIDKPEPVMPVP